MEGGGLFLLLPALFPALCSPGTEPVQAVLVEPAKGTPRLGLSPSKWCRCDHLREVMLTHRYHWSVLRVSCRLQARGDLSGW